MATPSKPCGFFRKGFCRYGVDCTYSHHNDSGSLPSQIVPVQSSAATTDNWRAKPRKAAQTAAPTPSTTGHTSKKPCYYFQDGRCMYGERCKLSHEILPRAPELNSDICPHFLAGTCIYGDKCRRSHPADMARDHIETTVRIQSGPKRISVSSLLESYR